MSYLVEQSIERLKYNHVRITPQRYAILEYLIDQDTQAIRGCGFVLVQLRIADGSAALIDVRPTERIDAAAREKFNRTRATAARLGWNYVVYEGASPVRQANLRFLMRYRSAAWRADAGHLRSGSRSLEQIAGELGAGVEGLGRCYHLVWREEVAVDLEEPLSLGTTARVKGER